MWDLLLLRFDVRQLGEVAHAPVARQKLIHRLFLVSCSLFGETQRESSKKSSPFIGLGLARQKLIHIHRYMLTVSNQCSLYNR